jgi:hypothetical protein
MRQRSLAFREGHQCRNVRMVAQEMLSAIVALMSMVVKRSMGNLVA